MTHIQAFGQDFKNHLATLPPPPYTNQEVATYIWTVLLPELEHNMTQFPQSEEYQQALLAMERLYNEAQTCNPDQLGQILSEAEALTTPPSDLAFACQEKMSDLNSQISSLQDQIEPSLHPELQSQLTLVMEAMLLQQNKLETIEHKKNSGNTRAADLLLSEMHEETLPRLQEDLKTIHSKLLA